MAPPVSASKRSQSRRRKSLNPHISRVDSIGVQGGIHKIVWQATPTDFSYLEDDGPLHKTTNTAAAATSSKKRQTNKSNKRKPARAPKAPAKNINPAAEPKGPCANPLCAVPTCPQWRPGPNGEVMCNACASYCIRHQGDMRDPAAMAAAKQAAAAARAAKAAAAGPSKTPGRRATAHNNREGAEGAEQQQQQQQTSSADGAAQAEAMPAPPSRVPRVTQPTTRPRDSLASDGAAPSSSNVMDSAPYCGLDVLQGLVELQGKRGREEEEEGAAEEEAGAVGRGSNKRRRTGQEEEVILLGKRAHKPSPRLVEAKESAAYLAQVQQQLREAALKAELAQAAGGSSNKRGGKRSWEGTDEMEEEQEGQERQECHLSPNTSKRSRR